MILAMANEMVGRGEEFDAIKSFLAAIETWPGALWISGEAGIGKTTLWRSGVEAANKLGLTVLTANPAEAERSLSFAALSDLMEPVLDQVLPELPEPQRRALEVALILRDPVGPAPDQRSIAAAFLTSLRSLADKRPVVVAVDDVQWLDRASASVLEFAVRRLRDEPVALVLATRSDHMPSGSADLIENLPVETMHRIILGPLSLGALHRMLLERLGSSLPRPTMHRVYELSGGNPFFALELARALAEEGGTRRPSDPITLPVSLRELVHMRLSSLPPESLKMIQVAAALSKPNVTIVTSAVRSEADSLGAAVDAKVIVLDGSRLRFTHPLLASGAYATLDSASRQMLHRMLAKLVVDPDERARQLARGFSEPNQEVAAEVEGAALRARARGAVATAAELMDQARTLTPAPLRDAMEWRALLTARYWFEAGDTVGAREMLDEWVSRAKRGERRAEMLAQLARIHLFEGDSVGAEELYRRANARAGSNLGLRSDCQIGLSFSVHQTKELRSAARHAQAAVRLAAQDHDVRALTIALSRLGFIDGLRGRRTAETHFQRALTVNGPVEHRMVTQEPSFPYGTYLIWTDRFEEARTRFRQAAEQAQQRGDESSLPLILSYLSMVECFTGNWNAADDASQRAVDAAAQAGQGMAHAVALASQALVAACRGDAVRARSAAAEAMARADDRGATLARVVALWALGILEVSSSNPIAAQRLLRPLVDEFESGGVAEPGHMRFAFDLVEALISSGEFGEAEARLARLEFGARRLDRASGLATAARCRGLLSASTGDLTAAEKWFEAALREHDRRPMPMERGRTLLAFGTTQRRAKQKRAARETLGAALTTFDDLGATTWATRTRAELGRIGGRTSAGTRLTSGEERVARLVAAGQSNKEVARALFVTERTVEANLSKIYAKLGVRSRTQLARRLTGGEAPTSS
jgi:DNA-binding CsgD family transcriptional regulator